MTAAPHPDDLAAFARVLRWVADAADEPELLLDLIGEHVAQRQRDAERDAEWMETKRAADYAGMHPDTLRKRAAAGMIEFEQEAPGCKMYFKRSALDEYRRTGGVRRLRAVP